MSILNVLLRPNQLLVAVDTRAENASTGEVSTGAKLLLIPQHNVVLAARGSTQFFLRMYELSLQVSFRADFTMEQLMAELGLVIDKLWPAYEKGANEASMHRSTLGRELVLGGWSPKNGRMSATAYAKHDSAIPAIVQPPDGGLASPGGPLEDIPDSFELVDVLAAGRRQAAWLNRAVGHQVAGGRLLVATLSESRAVVEDLGSF